MVVNNPNNWHWVDKNVLPWSKQYLSEELSKISHQDDDLTWQVRLTSLTGDADMSQRKGKAIVIYDLVLDFAVETTGELPISFNVSVPEFIHDMSRDDFQFIYKSSVEPKHKEVVKTNIFPKVLDVLTGYQDVVLKTHEADLKHYE